MSCTLNIAKNIISDCTTQKNGFLEVKAWIFSRADYANAITYDNTITSKITNIASVTTKKAFTLTGVKKLLNAGHDIVVADDRADKFTHFFSFQQFEIAAADVFNLDNLKDVFVVVERKDKGAGGDGTFVAYGVKNGLFKSTDTRRSNDINGARSLELTSLAGAEENNSEYTVLKTNYADTLAMLVALETEGA
jgi:hypothetical protein